MIKIVVIRFDVVREDKIVCLICKKPGNVNNNNT